MSARERFLEAVGEPGEGPGRDLGSPRVEAGALRGGCALGSRPRRGTLAFTGEDRHEFLHRMLTAAIRPGASGTGTHTLLLDGKGHVTADLDLLEGDDALIGVTGRGAVREVVSSLSRYVLRARVAMQPRGDDVCLALLGPSATEVLSTVALEAPAGLPSMTVGEVAGARVHAVRTPTLADGVELIVDRQAAAEVASALMDAGAVPVGEDVLETARIEAGIPAPGAELTGGEFPQEARLEQWVDFDKGCYLGQETVARIRYRGHVNRLLAGFQTAQPVAAGTELLEGERPAGTITSAARSDRFGAIALGYVRRELAEDGMALTTADGVAVRVAATPMG